MSRVSMFKRNTENKDVSVNLLTEREYRRIKALAPHDQPIGLDVWAAFLSKVLRRKLKLHEAHQIVTAYNARLREEYA